MVSLCPNGNSLLDYQLGRLLAQKILIQACGNIIEFKLIIWGFFKEGYESDFTPS